MIADSQLAATAPVMLGAAQIAPALLAHLREQVVAVGAQLGYQGRKQGGGHGRSPWLVLRIGRAVRLPRPLFSFIW